MRSAARSVASSCSTSGASRVKRQQVSGTVPIAKLSTGQMLSSVQASGGYYFGINGKQVVTDVQQRMYQQKYLIDTRSGVLVELDNPKGPRTNNVTDQPLLRGRMT